MKVSVIIPAYNEAAVIENNMRELEIQCAEMFDDFEIVIVSDGSTDGTWDIVRDTLVNLAERNNAGSTACHFIDAGYENNRGKGGALKAGVLAATGDIIVTTDCDLAYGCDVIGKAVKIMEEHPDCDLLIGSRSRADDGFAGYPPIRRIASKVYFKLLSFYAGIDVSDSQCGFKCYKSGAAKLIFGELETFGFAFDLEILLRAKNHKMKISEMPVTIKNHGESKINIIKDTLKMLSDVRKIKKRCSAANQSR